jgi:exosortase
MKPTPTAAASPPFPALERTTLLIGLAVAAAVLLLFGQTFLRLYDLWGKDPNYSHGYVIPLLSGWLAWRYLRRAGPPAQGEVRLGGLNLAVGCLVHLAAVVIEWPPLDFIALVFVLRGLAVTLGGRRWAAGFMFPILFLFFMFPLPVTWTGTAALWLQDWVSDLSAALLNLFVVCYRRGTSLYLAGLPEPLIVAEECSGLRQIVAFLALGTLVGYLSERPLPFRILLAAVAVPIAIAANVVRVLLMALGAKFFGTAWIHGWLHHVPAAFSVPLGLLLFLLAWWGLGLIWPKAEAAEGGAR